jgi:hypothetical protein
MTPVSWWLVFLPSILIALAFVLLNWLLWRKRSLRDWKRLRHAATMPPEHVAAEPRRAKDLAIGGQGFVGSYDVVASEKDHRAYVAWDARLVEPPKDPDDQFAPLRIRRLEGGFSLTVRPGLEFRTSPLPWGMYAPVIEIVQSAPVEKGAAHD